MYKGVSRQSSLLFIIIFTFVSLSEIASQQVISPLGADITGNGGTINFTIGQIAFNTYNSSLFSESQGVQQPYENSILTSVINHDDSAISCTIHPNPTIDALMINIKNADVGRFLYRIYDIMGNHLSSNTINQEVTNLTLATLPPAIYFINIIDTKMDSRTIFKTFKIIKT